MSYYAIMAVGVTFVIITGGIDISVGAIMALAALGSAAVLQNFAVDAPAWKVLPLGILGVLVAVDRRGGAAARPFLLPLTVGLYALARFGTEFLRPREADGLLVSQWLELGAAVGVVLLLTFGRTVWRLLVGLLPEGASG